MRNINFETKKEYRIFAKKLRETLDIEQISLKITQKIAKSDFFQKSKNIGGFYPFGSEINLTELYKIASKNWYLPRIEAYGNQMRFFPYKDGDILEENKYKISEPLPSAEINPEKLDLIIIPALMTDQNGNRIGYGAGFYDRYLPLLKKDCLKIVPLPEALFAKNLPHDRHDFPVDIVVTESRVYL